MRPVRSLIIGMLGLFLGGVCLRAGAADSEFSFHHDFVMGTSLDLTVIAPNEGAAEAVEVAVMAEIERLSGILSTYDPTSEISRMNAIGQPMRCSRELIEVLDACAAWRERSGGAFNAQLGRIIDLWKAGQKADRLPDAARLAELVKEANQPAYSTQAAAGTAVRLTPVPLNVDALGKGYIIDKAMAAARAKVPQASGILLAVGGDMMTWGRASAEAKTPWRIAVADPAHPQENAAPLRTLLVTGRAVATSAGYARNYLIAGERYSHIFDPRTGQPARGVASATVVADECINADALSTTLYVLGPVDGLKLVDSLRSEGKNVACLIVAADGRQFASAGWDALAAPEPASKPIGLANSNWPAGFEVNINIGIAQQTGGRRAKRPYVIVWIEDAKGQPVRTLAVWGNETKYLKEMTKFWAFAKNDPKAYQAVTRATRAPGRYDLAWNGLDDKGKPVPAGSYTVRIEAAREKGGHVNMSGKIDCTENPATAKIEANGEMEETNITFGKPEKKP